MLVIRLVLIASVVFLACGTPETPVKDLPCLPDIIKLQDESANCTEAQLKVDVLLRYSEQCKKLFGDGGFNVCEKLDGGKHD